MFGEVQANYYVDASSNENINKIKENSNSEKVSALTLIHLITIKTN